MAPVDERIAALQAEIAALEGTSVVPPVVSSSTPNASDYGVKQLAFDIPTGALKAGAGLLDLVTYLNPFRAASVGGYGAYKAPVSELVSGAAETIAPTIGVRPQTEGQRLVEFITPIPGLSKGRMLADALLGGTSYVGTRVAEWAAPESEIAKVVTGLGAPLAAQSIVNASKAVATKASPVIGTLVGNEDILRQEATKEVLREIGPQGVAKLQELAPAAPITGFGDIPLTLAERVQTPEAALYQTAIQQRRGGEPLVTALGARQAGISEALTQVAPVPEQGAMQIAMKSAAEQAATAKAAQEAKTLELLGLTPTGAATTPVERGDILQQSLMTRREQAKKIPQTKWAEVDKTIVLDANEAFADALKAIEQIGPQTRQTFSPGTNNRIARLETIQNKARGKAQGTLTLGDMQDLRSATLETLKDVRVSKQGAEGPEQKVLSDILSAIESDAVKVAKGQGDVSKWYEARKATKEYKQTFTEGVVGELTALRGWEPKVKTSQVVNRVLKYPENAQELLRKFGKDSVEATELRTELLSRLSEDKNPAQFLKRNIDTYKAAFQGDFYTVENYVKSRAQAAPLDEYAAIKEAAIPSRVFENATTAEQFAKQFANSPILGMGRGKFLDSRILTRGNPLDNLNENRSIAQKLFGDDLPKIEAILRDREISKSPDRLRKLITGGNSITRMTGTTLGALASTRGVINLMKKGGIGGIVMGGNKSLTSAIMNMGLGAYVERLGQAREDVMDRFVAQMLADPRTINLAAMPPTPDRVQQLANLAVQYGYLGTKINEEVGQNTGDLPTETLSIDQRNELLRAEIAKLEAELQ